MNAITPAQLSRWQEAVGREIVEESLLEAGALARFALAVGADGDAVPLPHWAFFLPAPKDADIGPDGHPKRGDFLPDISLPRRMFAASSVEFAGPLQTGTSAVQTSRVAELTHKAGRSGDLVFAKVEKRIEQNGALKVREVQTYVYRDMGDSVPMPGLLPKGPEGERWQPDEVNLFRFSAATGNGHRIHYDQPYTTQVEGYPALIVHGPFTAARLAALAMRDGELAQFSFRALAPLFLGQPIVLRRTGDGEYEAVRCDGATAMTATATFR